MLRKAAFDVERPSHIGDGTALSGAAEHIDEALHGAIAGMDWRGLQSARLQAKAMPVGVKKTRRKVRCCGMRDIDRRGRQRLRCLDVKDT
jgi:hypothetical protein